MKKFLTGLTIFLNFIVAFILGIFIIAVSIDPSNWPQIKAFILDRLLPFIGLRKIQGFFAILIILQIYYLYLNSKSVPRTKYIAFGNPDGEVLLTVSAIEDFISKIAKPFKEIQKLDAKVTPVRDGIYINLNAVLTSGNNLPTVTEEIQRNIKYQVQNILGIENVQGIEMQIVEILEQREGVEQPLQDVETT